jgi:hypothetical protein
MKQVDRFLVAIIAGVVVLVRGDALCHIAGVCVPPHDLCRHPACAVRPDQRAGRAGIWLVPESPWTALFVICGAVNASGASGDLWMTQIALRYPNTARLMDERDGIRVFVPNGPPSERMRSKDPLDQKSKRQSAKESQMGVGIAIGVAFGLALGVALNNIPTESV